MALTCYTTPALNLMTVISRTIVYGHILVSNGLRNTSRVWLIRSGTFCTLNSAQLRLKSHQSLMKETERVSDTFEIHSVVTLRATTASHSVGTEVSNPVFHLVKYAMPSSGHCTNLVACRIWTELGCGKDTFHVTNIVHFCHLTNISYSCLH